MKVVVFGSTGTIGQHLIQQALEQGHEVSAFCRDATKLVNPSHPNLTIHLGDVLVQNQVEEAVSGQDVVCIALGAGKKRKSTVRSQGTQTVIAAMKATGVKRLICQSTLGAGESRGNLNFFWKHIMFGWYLKQVFLDHELQEYHVQQSELDWTIVRPGAFSDGERTRNYQHGFSPNTKDVKLKISRADVADFIVKQLASTEYLFKTPGLSY